MSSALPPNTISPAIPWVPTQVFTASGIHARSAPRNPSTACLSGRHQDTSRQLAQAQTVNPRATSAECLNLSSLYLLLNFCLFNLAQGSTLDFSILITVMPQPCPHPSPDRNQNNYSHGNIFWVSARSHIITWK